MSPFSSAVSFNCIVRFAVRILMSIKIKSIAGLVIVAMFGFAITSAVAQPVKAQPKSSQQKPAPPVKAEPKETRAGDALETAKVDSNLVTVPVIASSPTGTYISDLTKGEFNVLEDGAPQQIAFLATVNEPFHVVLMLDTSAGTREKLPLIQRAASAFVDQLSASDKVKIITFDDKVRDWNNFTSDRASLKGLIARTQSGDGTKVYDAVELALNVLRPIAGRKAIVLFTDGMDWQSDASTFAGTVRYLEETGVIVYPIRFDTRTATERLARDQDARRNGNQLPTSDVIRSTPSRPTPSTFPGDEPSSLPTPRADRRTSLPQIIVTRPDPRREPEGSPTDQFPRTEPPPQPRTTREPVPEQTRDARRADEIRVRLDQTYSIADSYLKELAERSGGHLHRADTIVMLPQAFAAIAAELRTQYLIGYYPANPDKNLVYRKIHVGISRKDVVIRARPGYRVSDGQ